MFAFIFAIIFATAVAYFATQNTSTITIHFIQYSWSGIPIYLLVLFSLLFGFLFAWLLHLMNALSVTFLLRGKEDALKKAKDKNLELTKQIHQLELENTKLITKKGESPLQSNSL